MSEVIASLAADLALPTREAGRVMMTAFRTDAEARYRRAVVTDVDLAADSSGG